MNGKSKCKEECGVGISCLNCWNVGRGVNCDENKIIRTRSEWDLNQELQTADIDAQGRRTDFIYISLLAHVKTECNYGEGVKGGASPRGSPMNREQARDRGCPAYGF